MSLKILSIIDVFGVTSCGGAGKVFIEVNKALSEKGHSVDVICRSPDDIPDDLFEGINFHTYRDIAGGQISKIKHYQRSVKNLFAKQMEDNRPSLIIIHSSSAVFGLDKMLKSLDIPIIYYFHSPWNKEYEIIADKKCCGIQCPLVTVLSSIRKRHEAKYLKLADGIVTLSQSMQQIMLDVHKGIEKNPKIIIPGGANGDLYKALGEGCEKLIVNSEQLTVKSEELTVKSEELTVKSEQLTVKSEELSGISERVKSRRELSLPEDAFLIITSRRLVPRTGVDVLIKAFAKVKKTLGGGVSSEELIVNSQQSTENSEKLIVNSGGEGEIVKSEELIAKSEKFIVHSEEEDNKTSFKEKNDFVRKNLKLLLTGSGSSEDELKKLALDLEIEDDVIFTGYVSEHKLAEYYRCSDLFVMPTKFLEGFGLSTVEAMASGLPIIGTDIGGTPEILRKISEELIIPECSVDAIADKILEFVSKSDDELNELRKKSAKCAKENFTWEKHVDKLLEFVKCSICRSSQL